MPGDFGVFDAMTKLSIGNKKHRSAPVSKHASPGKPEILKVGPVTGFTEVQVMQKDIHSDWSDTDSPNKDIPSPPQPKQKPFTDFNDNVWQ